MTNLEKIRAMSVEELARAIQTRNVVVFTPEVIDMGEVKE